MKTLKALNRIVDGIYKVIFILIILIGLYYVYDTAYTFYNASTGRILASKPGSDGVATAGKALTEDYVAWLTIDDTSIDYPIMKGATNSVYLNTDPYGDYSLAGSIFMDYRNAEDFSDSYSLVYGHHMSSNLMFGTLDKFYDEDYYQKHKTGTITLKDGRIYDIYLFACIETDANVEEVFDPDGSESLLEAFDEGDFYERPRNKHIVALSTCMEPGTTDRTVVLASMELEKES